MKVFIENEAGSNIKNLFNEETLEYRKSVEVSASYPFPYGFLLNTKSGDGDSLDCFVLTNEHLKSRQIVEVEPIGMFEEIEDGEEDHKILAVLVGESWQTDENLEQNFRDFSAKVFSHLPNKKKIVGRFLGKDDALRLIEKSKSLQDNRENMLKKKILITGIAGSGKSTVCNELLAMGYEAYGIEDIEGMFAMYRKGTKEIFSDFDNSDPEKIKNSEWLCDIEKLKELTTRQHNAIAFYCGIASNMDDLFPLFDKVLMLQTDAKSLHARLSTREGKDDMGNTEASRQTVLGWKDWWENEMEEKGAVVVDARDNPHLVAERILSTVSN